MSDKKYNILLVEDDEVDVMNVKRGLEKSNIRNPLSVANDGIEALEILRNKKIQAPLLILLDIKMPRMGGIEFLNELRNDPEWKNTPVVILTSSKSEKDRMQAYNLLVSGYIVKPVNFGDFMQALSAIGSYWSLCEFPPTEV